MYQDDDIKTVVEAFNDLDARVQKKKDAIGKIEQARQWNLDRRQRGFDDQLSRLRNILAEALRQEQAQEVTHAQQKVPQTQLVLAPRRPPPVKGPNPKGPMPGLMALLFAACHVEKDRFSPVRENQHGILRLSKKDSRGRNAHIDLRHPDEMPREYRNANADPQQFGDWVREGTLANLMRLDDLAWEIGAFIVISFLQQTSGTDVDEEFYVFVNDFFEWRGVHPSNRTPELRQKVKDRIRLLFQLRMYAEDTLHLLDERTGRKKLTTVTAHGPFLRESLCYDQPEGYLVSLGKWAKEYVAATAMLGVYLRRLAEYNPHTQHWERQIGWYLVFQLQNQASRMKYAEVDEELQAVMVQSLRMESILDGACLPWQRLAQNDPGKVIRQFVKALDALKSDGILSSYECLDGAADGSDIARRKGKLEVMLERRYKVSPGADLVPHYFAKKTARNKSQARSIKRQALGDKAKDAEKG